MDLSAISFTSIASQLDGWLHRSQDRSLHRSIHSSPGCRLAARLASKLLATKAGCGELELLHTTCCTKVRFLDPPIYNYEIWSMGKTLYESRSSVIETPDNRSKKMRPFQGRSATTWSRPDFPVSWYLRKTPTFCIGYRNRVTGTPSHK